MRLARSSANFLRPGVGLAALLAVCACALAGGCRGGSRSSPEGAAEDVRAVAPAPTADARATAQPIADAGNAAPAIVDARPAALPAPSTLEEALARLRVRGLERAANIIAARAAQRSRKMKLTAEQALAAATSVLRHLSSLPRLRALHDVLPHSAVELARAIDERGVPASEAERIADYLSALTAHLDFANLERFDINHSHVTGREWHEIDYSGENMTWQSQKKYWSKKGVQSFKKAEYIHHYFTHAYHLPHFARVYRPRSPWAGFQWP